MIAIVLLIGLVYGLLISRSFINPVRMAPLRLLTDPFLQLPTATSVRVVWFTEFPGSQHTVAYGANLEQTVVATTTKLSRVREDRESAVAGQTEANLVYSQPTDRDIWRHEAEVTGLSAGLCLPYRVTSAAANDRSISSDQFMLCPTPIVGQPLKILLTSDHQLKSMTAANLQKVVETVGPVDAVFLLATWWIYPIAPQSGLTAM